MGFSAGFEKIAYMNKEAFIMPALKGVGRGVAGVAGKGLSAGLKGAGKVFGGSTGPIGMLGLAAQGASTIGSYKQNKALMQGAVQR